MENIFLYILEISWALEVTGFLCILCSPVGKHMISGVIYFTVNFFPSASYRVMTSCTHTYGYKSVL